MISFAFSSWIIKEFEKDWIKLYICTVFTVLMHQRLLYACTRTCLIAWFLFRNSNQIRKNTKVYKIMPTQTDLTLIDRLHVTSRRSFFCLWFYFQPNLLFLNPTGFIENKEYKNVNINFLRSKLAHLLELAAGSGLKADGPSFVARTYFGSSIFSLFLSGSCELKYVPTFFVVKSLTDVSIKTLKLAFIVFPSPSL